MRNPMPGLVVVFAVFCATFLHAQTHVLPSRDQRADEIRTLNTLRTFPTVTSKADWDKRAKKIREQILISAGLWPMPEKTPLQPKIFGRIDRDGYSVEKVYFETLPGFYLCGNLYRPHGQGKGPFPGILNAHGHWAEGRLVDNKDSSIPGRCINLARQGMVAFSYDMFGFNDTHFPFPEGFHPKPKEFYGIHRHFGTNDATPMLWNITLMGLQTWNSIRALDFLESLPEVDKKRLACTGASGGGTQTFMLGAIDDRLAAQAPICMVSHSMQGGCGCENMPGLRIEFSNMEIASEPSPRPQILVASFSDWTKETMTIEGPAVESIYKFFDASDKLRYVRFDFGHNYNQTSREAVYQFFAKHLLGKSDADAVREKPFTKEPDSDLRVWPDDKLPADAVTEEQLIHCLVRRSTAQLQRLQPTNRESLIQYQQTLFPAWQHTLQLDLSERGLRAEVGDDKSVNGGSSRPLVLGHIGKGDRIPALLLTPEKTNPRTFVILVHAKGKAAFLDDRGEPIGLARKLIEKNFAVLLMDTFLTGELADEKAAKARAHQVDLFFTTYNRTDLQERVQDIVTACAFAKGSGKGTKNVILCGVGRAGLWAMLAAPVADAVAVDADNFDSESDSELVKPDLFVPGLRTIGGFQGAASLGAPRRMFVHNVGKNFQTETLRNAYAVIKADKALRIETAQADDDALAKWMVELR